MINKLNFIEGRRLIVDGTNELDIDFSINWKEVELASPISIDNKNKIHPFIDGEVFVGLLSYKGGMKNSNVQIEGVNVIEICYLKAGSFFYVRAGEDIKMGDGLKPASNGFIKATDTSSIKCFAITNALEGNVLTVRGGNY